MNSNVKINELTPDTSIESKLQGIAAAYRRERDEAHRSKHLAIERLKLTQQEADAAKNTVSSLVRKLENLKKQSGADATKELESWRTEALNLTNQVEFQHKELLTMQDKLKGLVEQESTDQARRKSAELKIQAVLKTRREDIAHIARSSTDIHKFELTMKPSKDALSRNLKDDYHESQSEHSWCDIVNARAEAINRETKIVQQSVDLMDAIVARYELQFGLSVAVFQPDNEMELSQDNRDCNKGNNDCNAFATQAVNNAILSPGSHSPINDSNGIGHSDAA